MAAGHVPALSALPRADVVVGPASPGWNTKKEIGANSTAEMELATCLGRTLDAASISIKAGRNRSKRRTEDGTKRRTSGRLTASTRGHPARSVGRCKGLVLEGPGSAHPTEVSLKQTSPIPSSPFSPFSPFSPSPQSSPSLPHSHLPTTPNPARPPLPYPRYPSLSSFPS